MSPVDVDAFAAFEAVAWEREAADYGVLAGRVTRRLVDPPLDAVGAGSRILDVGTGTGHVAARAAERGGEAVGVDLSEAMLGFARAQHPSVEFVRGDAPALPFELPAAVKLGSGRKP